MLSKLWSTLEGKKTYILGLLAIGLWLGWVFDAWTLDEIDQLLALIGILTGLSFRSAIQSAIKK